MASGNWVAALELLQPSEFFKHLSGQESRPDLEAKRLCFLADCYNAMGVGAANTLGIQDPYLLAQKSASKALKLLKANSSEVDLRAQVLNALGISKWYLTSPVDALKFFETARNLLVKSNSTKKTLLLHTSLQNMALCYHAIGNLSAATGILSDLVALMDEVEAPEQKFDLKIRLANLYADDGKHAAAKSLLDEIRPVESSEPDLLVRWYNASALLANSAGNVLLADSLFDRIHDLFSLKEVQGGNRLAALTNAASFKLEKGWNGQALAIVELIESRLQKSAPFWFHIGYQKLKLRLAFRFDDQDGARQAYRSACKMIESQAGGNTEQLLEIAMIVLVGKSPEDLRRAAKQQIGNILCIDGLVDATDILHGERFDALCCLLYEMDEVSEAELMNRLLPFGITANLLRSRSPLGWRLFHALSRRKAAEEKYCAAILAGKLALYEIISSIRQTGSIGTDGEKSLAECEAASVLLGGLMIRHGLIEEWQHIEHLMRAVCADPDDQGNYYSLPDQLAETLFSKVEHQIVGFWLKMRLDIARQHTLAPGMQNLDEHTAAKGPQAAAATLSFLKSIDALDERSMRNSHPRLAGSGAGARISKLATHSAHLGLYEGMESCLVTLERDGRITSRHLKANPKTIREAVNQAKRQILCGDENWRQTGRYFYEMIFAEVMDELSNCNEIFIASSGFFDELPLEIANCQNGLLVEHFAFQRSSPERQTRSPTSQNGNQVVIAGASSGKGPFADLAHVDSETRHIAEMFPGSTVLLNADFTKQALIAALNLRPSILHFATHFMFLPGAPGSSYFHTGASERLSLEEIFGHEDSLRGIDLVFNCACGSARMTSDIISEWHPDKIEKTLSVADLFIFRGGAKAYIGTAWDITDAAAARCASEFYRHVREGETYAKALQTTIVNMSMEEEFSSPTDWAAFRLFTSG